MNKKEEHRTDSENKGEELLIEYPYISKLFLLLFCGYVFIWYLQIGYRIPALGAIRFEFIYAAALTAVAIFATPKFDLKCPLLPYVILYFFVIAIQIPFSHDFATSWAVFVDRIIKFAFMAFFIVAFVRSPTHLKFFLAAFLLACLKMGQEGLVGRLSGGLIWENQGIMRLHGPTPNYGHPNSFAGMALGTLPFVYFLWPVCKKYYKAVLFVIGLLSLNIIVYSGSRTAYVGVMAFLIYAFFVSNNKKTFIFSSVIFFVIILSIVPLDYHERFKSIFTQQEKEGQSAETRIEILKDAYAVFKEYPLGVGVAAFPKVRFLMFGRSQDTHNLYYEILTNLGVQGLIVFIIFIYKMMSILNKIRNTTIEKINIIIENRNLFDEKIFSDLKLVNAVATGTIAFIFIRLSLGVFGMDLYEVYWWFSVGITFSLYSIMVKMKTLF